MILRSDGKSWDEIDYFSDPISKWTKKRILREVKEYSLLFSDIDKILGILNEMSLEDIRSFCLEYDCMCLCGDPIGECRHTKYYKIDWESLHGLDRS